MALILVFTTMMPKGTPDKSEFVSQRARGAYITVFHRPDIAFEFAQCSQMVQITESSTKFLKCLIKTAK